MFFEKAAEVEAVWVADMLGNSYYGIIRCGKQLAGRLQTDFGYVLDWAHAGRLRE